MINLKEWLEKKPEEEQIRIREELRTKMWPDSARRSQSAQLSRFLANPPESIKLWWVKVIFQVTGITPNEFFGYTPPQKKIPEKKLDFDHKYLQQKTLDQIVGQGRKKIKLKLKKKI